MASLNWEVINKETGHCLLQLPLLSTINQCTLVMEDVIKHKGPIKDNGNSTRAQKSSKELEFA